MSTKVKGIGMTSRRTRQRLITRLREEGITNEKVLATINQIPRHLFVDEALGSRAYEDTALPIGFGQTISQPYIVALMTQALLGEGNLSKVLEVGTGSGYQTAILAALGLQIFSVERIAPLIKLATQRLRALHLENVQFKLSDGSWGWPEHAPYDAIIVTAAPVDVPQPLVDQLALGGQMVIPVGRHTLQELLLLTKDENGITRQRLELVNFVPLIPN